jgi:hypothetical protein
MPVDTTEQVLEDALDAWQQGSELLESLPALSPDHETVRLTVMRLRGVYEEIVARRHQGTAVISSSRKTIAAANDTLRTVRMRHNGDDGAVDDGAPGASPIESNIRKTIIQAEQLLALMDPYSAEHGRIAGAIRELEQIEAMLGDGSDGAATQSDVRRAIVDAQLAIAEAGRHRGAPRLTQPGNPRLAEAL